jgi:hypothetical protein
MRSAKKPSRTTPETKSTTPTTKASVVAVTTGSSSEVAMAEAVRIETVEVVLTLRGRDVPRAA